VVGYFNFDICPELSLSPVIKTEDQTVRSVHSEVGITTCLLGTESRNTRRYKTTVGGIFADICSCFANDFV
jgi:hypothetical protein